MTNPNRADLVRLGIQVTISGELAELRRTLQLTRNAMAHLMEVTPDALRRWEEGSQGMNHSSALRVGEWVWAARRLLDSYIPDTLGDLTNWVPLATASQYLSLSAEEIEAKCEEGHLECHDLGVLGLYVHRSSIPRLNDMPENSL